MLIEMETNKLLPTIHVEKGSNSEDECDNLNDSQVNEYKELVYKFFQFRTYKLRCSNGDFGCPFCDYKEEHRHQYAHLLLHAIRVAEDSEHGKQRANHFAMARYLVIDLAYQFKAEADRLLKGEMDAHDKALHLETELNEKEDYISHLITKERQSNDELQAARKQIIEGLSDILRGTHEKIGLKNVGEIDSKAFITEMEKRFSSLEDAAIKGVELCSVWQENLKNPQWHPYRVVVDETGKPQRMIKEDDAALQDLKKEWGQEVHDAVVVAMNELQEYNPSGCYVVPELWNFNENRKAKLDEVISYIIEAVKDVSKKRITLEIYNKKEEIYKLLKSCTYDVRGGLRCPFCSVEEDKEYDYLLRHALMVAEASSESPLQRANHYALAKYLVLDLQDGRDAVPQSSKYAIAYESEEEDDFILPARLNYARAYRIEEEDFEVLPRSSKHARAYESEEEDDKIVEESSKTKQRRGEVYNSAADCFTNFFEEVKSREVDWLTNFFEEEVSSDAELQGRETEVQKVSNECQQTTPPPSPRRASTRLATKRARRTSGDPGSSSGPSTKRARRTSGDPGSSSRPSTKRTRKISKDPGSSSKN